MAISKKNIRRGVRIKPDAVALEGKEGEIKVGSVSNKIEAYLNGSSRSVVTEDQSASLSNKTIVVANNTITTAASGNLAATELNAALAELQSDIDTRATSADLTAHINDASDAHDASAISNVPAGTIAATDVQAAINELDGDIQAHIADATAAHAASAVSVTPSGDLGSTDVQSALVELQGDIDALEAGVGNYVSGPASATDNAIARYDLTTGKLIQNSDVTIDDSNVMSGATQLNVDNLRLDGNTVSSTDSNGNIVLSPNGTGVVNTTKNATFDALINFASTNDTATGSNATLSTPTTKVIRLTNASLLSVDGIPGGTSARELIIENATGATVAINEDTGATAANRFYTGTTTGINLADKASLYLSYDGTSSRWRVIGGSGSGSGSGQAPDVFVQLVGEELVATWASGDNATFLGGGTLSGTFAKDTSTPLNGTASYLYTQAAGSLDDYIASPLQTVPVRFRGNQATCSFAYNYNGNNTDIEPIVYDVTNSTKLTTSTNLLPASGTNSSIYKVNFLIPLTCTQIRFGFHVKALNSGKVLEFDDVQIGSDTGKFADPSIITEWQSYTPTFTGFGTATSVEFQWRRSGSDVEVRGKFVSGTSTATEARITLPNSYSSAGTSAIPSIQIAGKANRSTSSTTDFSSRSILIEPSVAYFTIGNETSTASGTAKANGDAIISSGQTLTLFAKTPIAGLSASNPQIVTASDSFSTDSASLVYASSATYTVTTLADAPVGTFITFTYASTGNTRTQTTTAPTQTTTDMNTNGIQLFTRAYNAASASASPSVVAIQIGKNLKGVATNLYKASSKVNAGTIDRAIYSSTVDSGLNDKSYNESTGILIIDAGGDNLTTNTSRLLNFADGTTQTSGYVVINASKSPALVGVSQLQQRIALLTDVKAASTAGGGATGGAFATRTLNTLSDPSNIGVTLASNQFSLVAGEYFIEASAPAYSVDNHQIRIRNITDSTTDIVGSSETSVNGAAPSSSRSWAIGRILITATKTFELQHYFTTTKTTNGQGAPGTSGAGEVYSIVKITKVK